jgi:hypothetical protein
MEKPWFTNEMVYISCSTPEAVNQKGMCPIAGIRFTTYPELWNHRAADDTEVF